MTGELAEAGLLLKTFWTYQEFLEQPDWLVEDMLLLLNAEAEHMKSQLKR